MAKSKIIECSVKFQANIVADSWLWRFTNNLNGQNRTLIENTFKMGEFLIEIPNKVAKSTNLMRHTKFPVYSNELHVSSKPSKTFGINVHMYIPKWN